MKKLFLFPLIFWACRLSAQLPLYQWASNITLADNFGYAITTDVSDNIIVAGAFLNTVDFDWGAGTTTLTATGSSDLYVAKYTSSGSLLWVKQIANASANDVKCDAANNIYIAGQYHATTDLDPGSGVASFTVPGNSSQPFVEKLDQNGSMLWYNTNTTFDQNLSGSAQRIAIDNDNQFAHVNYSFTNYSGLSASSNFVSGSCSGNVAINPSSSAAIVQRIDLNTGVCQALTSQWTGTSGGTALDASGNFYYAQHLNTGTSMKLRKEGPYGTGVWIKSLGSSSGTCSIKQMKTDASSNLITAGSFTCCYNFGGGVLNSGGLDDIFFAKYDGVTGNYMWSKSIGSTGSDIAYDMFVDGSDNIIICGMFQGTVDFDPGSGVVNLTSSGFNDGFIAKYDKNGNYLWVFQLGGASDDESTAITQLPNGDFLSAGYFKGVIDFNPDIASTATLSSASNSNSFVAKYSNPCSSAPAQPGTIYGASTVCAGVSVTFSVTSSPGAGAYNWQLPAGWTGSSTTSSISVTPGAAAGTITVSVLNNCGTSNTQTLSIGVNTVPSAPGSISGAGSICSGTTGTYSISTVSGASYYTWTLPGTWTGSSTTNTISTTAGSSGGTISVTANNACGNSAAQTISVNVGPPSMPSAILGLNSICAGSSNTYSVAPVSGVTSYTWNAPGGWTGTSATNTISLAANSSSGNITVKANNSCGSSTAQTLSVTVNPIPTIAVSGGAICVGQSFTLSPSGANTYTYSSGASVISPSITTSYSVTGASSAGCVSSSPGVATVTVNPLPSLTVTAAPSATVCAGTSLTLTGSGASSYTWSGGAVNGVAFPASSGATYTVTGTDANNCQNTSIISIVVNPLPAVSIFATSNTLCVNDSPVALTGTPAGGAFGGPGVSGNSFDPAITGVGTFAITYSYTDGNSCSNSDSTVMMVNACTGSSEIPGPDIPFVIYPNPCSDVVIILSRGPSQAKVTVYNLVGETIYSESFTNPGSQVTVDLSNKRSGVYYMRFQTESGTVTKKIIKQ